MISESYYWKEPLLESASAFEKLEQTDNLSEEDMDQIEKGVFIEFYSILKLMDTMYISDSTKEYKLSVAWYKNIQEVDGWNSHKLDELYDYSSENLETRSLRFICNQIVHSFIFRICESEE